jgi:hypothetical protein
VGNSIVAAKAAIPAIRDIRFIPPPILEVNVAPLLGACQVMCAWGCTPAWPSPGTAAGLPAIAGPTSGCSCGQNVASRRKVNPDRPEPVIPRWAANRSREQPARRLPYRYASRDYLNRPGPNGGLWPPLSPTREADPSPSFHPNSEETAECLTTASRTPRVEPPRPRARARTLHVIPHARVLKPRRQALVRRAMRCAVAASLPLTPQAAPARQVLMRCSALGKVQRRRCGAELSN